MITFSKTSVILSIAVITLISAEEYDESTVDELINWYNRRSQEVLEYQLPTDARMYEAANKIPQEYGGFDFIVVGGGSAGCVVASRLSEISHWNVLLLEAGIHQDENYTKVPAWNNLNINSKYNWGFKTVPQQNTFLGIADRRPLNSRGKGVGGSSLINGMAYSRGDKQDYDLWAEMVNDPGWNYENVLPYFKKSETFTRTNPFVPIDEKYHGFNGPLHMTQLVPPQNFSGVMLRAAAELGYNITDYNGKQSLGASIFQYYIKHGLRFDPDTAFLAPIRNRKNLKVLDKSYVTKIVFSANSKKVEGVIFTRNNRTYIARSHKEVILSAGAISSPQILILSGIGPRDHLQSLGIPVVQDLPVGRNLLDHSITYLLFKTNYTKETQSLKSLIKDLLKGHGWLTEIGAFDAVGFFKTSVERIENYPDVEMMIGNSSSVVSIYSDEIAKVFSQDLSNSLGIQVLLLHQKSTGTVTLKSADPFVYPLIDPNYYSDKENADLETLYQAVQIFLRLTETPSLRRLNASLVVRQLPGCNHTELSSREYWYCYFKTITGLGLHNMGTCRISTSPSTGVVDSKLQVFGVKGLRVADAGVIPLAVSGHTNAPSTMIGEKASDLIKVHYTNSHHILN